MVKVIIGFVVVCAIGLAVMYKAGGFSSWDPSEEGRAAKAKIKPGMTLAQVLKVASKPRSFSVYHKIKKTIDGEEIEVVVGGADMSWDRPTLETTIKAGKATEGYLLSYWFGEQVAFAVVFDGSGKVTGVHDEMTTADLLGTRNR